MQIDTCQNLIIGTGEAGKWLAWTLGKQGQKCIAVERGLLGGACPNVACLPSKNIIHSAKIVSLASQAGDLGINMMPSETNMVGVFARKRAMVEREHKAHVDNFAASGTEVVYGEAQFVKPLTVRVALAAGGERSIRGERMFLNLGSRASIPDVPGLREASPLTHVEALDLQKTPKHLVVLGGGYVGLEFAQAMRRFGSQVTVIQHGPRLLDREDTDVSDAIAQLLKDEGIAVRLATRIKRVSGKSGNRVTLELDDGSNVEASDILVATGRMPNTDRIDTKAGGIDLDPRGFIRVDERLRTTAPNVWAMGDCAGSPMFTHVSFDDFTIVRDNLAGKDRTTRDRLIPYCLFTDPELAHVGLNETQAIERDIAHRVIRIDMSDVLRTHTLGETRGFAKMTIGSDGQILGFTAFGPDVTEMMAIVQTAMIAKLPYTTLAEIIFAHPTMSEGIGTLCRKAIASAPRA
jgi:pyruvate/2-oxoglutarate dehydrogenase complex dihydrolipoamide dehydrogenase (E3) component